MELRVLFLCISACMAVGLQDRWVYVQLLQFPRVHIVYSGCRDVVYIDPWFLARCAWFSCTARGTEYSCACVDGW